MRCFFAESLAKLAASCDAVWTIWMVDTDRWPDRFGKFGCSNKSQTMNIFFSLDLSWRDLAVINIDTSRCWESNTIEFYYCLLYRPCLQLAIVSKYIQYPTVTMIPTTWPLNELYRFPATTACLLRPLHHTLTECITHTRTIATNVNKFIKYSHFTSREIVVAVTTSTRNTFERARHFSIPFWHRIRITTCRPINNNILSKNI